MLHLGVILNDDDAFFSSERVLKSGVITPCVLVAGKFVHDTARGAATRPPLHSRLASADA